MRIRLFKSRSVFISWLATYFLLLLMPVLISTVVYFEAYNIVRNDMITENGEALKQAGSSIDSGMQDARNFNAFVSFSQTLNLLVQEKDLSYIKSHYYLVNSALNELKSYRFQNEYVQDFYVYFRQIDSVLTTNGFYDSRYFFDHYQKGTLYRNVMTFDGWKGMMDESYAGSYRTFEGKASDAQTVGRTVQLLYSLPIFGGGRTNATFVISLDNSRFHGIMGGISSSSDCWGLILDGNDTVLFSTIPSGYAFPVRYEDMPEDAGFINTKVGGRDVAVSYRTSEIGNWKYVSVTPLQVFQAKVSYIRNLIVAGIAFSIVLGGILAWVFSRRNYRPVSELIREIEKKFRPPSDKETDEYRFIRGAMDATFNEKDAISERLVHQGLILRSNFLARLLKGRFEDGLFIDRALEKYGLDFNSGSFAVLLFCLSGGNTVVGQEGADGSDGIEQAGRLAAGITEGIAGAGNHAYTVDVDRMLACVVNFKQGDARENGCKLSAAALEVAAMLRDECGMEALASASDIHDTMFGIPDAYQEALSVMEYKKVMDAGDIVAYGQISVSSQGYSYPMETERQLINCIKAGDSDAAKACMNGIFERNFKKTVLSAGMTKCLVFDIMGTIFKTVSETGILKEGSFIQELDVAGRLLDSDDFQTMRGQAEAILEEICSYIQRNRKPRKDSLLDQVTGYIASNYHDANLSVSQIADRFGLTPAYLTRLFKEQSGEGLLDYITEVRMENAKRMLMKKGVNIKDVAAKVGYYSSTAFIRTFKKTEGVTPGSFKEIG